MLIQPGTGSGDLLISCPLPLPAHQSAFILPVLHQFNKAEKGSAAAL